MNNSNQLKIFLVDDDVFHLNLLRQILVGLGYEDISLFENGVDCLNRLTDKPDIVFLDYCMETYSGNEVLVKIKRYDPNIYTVIVSGQDEIKPVVDALKYGAFDYIEKGSDLSDKVKIVLQKICDIKKMLERKKSGFFKIFNL